MKKLSSELDLPLVCTNDAHYAKQSHWEAHDIHICLGTGKQRSDPKRLRYATPEFYFKSQDDMFRLFKEFPQAIENTRKISDSIDLVLPIGESHLPNFPIPESSTTKNPDEYLKLLTNEGAENLYGEIFINSLSSANSYVSAPASILVILLANSLKSSTHMLGNSL